MEGVEDHLVDRLKAIPQELGRELHRQAIFGSYELGSALFNGHAYRGDLGLLTNQQGIGIHGPDRPENQQQENQQQQQTELEPPGREM